MRQYYLHNGEQQTGPFSLEELRQRPLRATDMVWFDGLADWTAITTVEELKPLLDQSVAGPPPFRKKDIQPPPFKGVANQAVVDKNTGRKGAALGSGLVKFLWLFGLLALAVLVIFAIQRYRGVTTSTTDVAEPTYEEQVLSIEDQEKANPRKFLKATGTYHETFLSNKFKIDGTVMNTATVAKFKNVVLEVSFYTNKDKYIQSERYTIEDLFPAGSTKDFKLKVNPPKGAESCKWKAVGGVAY